MIVITDGQSADPAATKHEAQLLHNQGVQVYAVGVGSDVSKMFTVVSSIFVEYQFLVDFIVKLIHEIINILNEVQFILIFCFDMVIYHELLNCDFYFINEN